MFREEAVKIWTREGKYEDTEGIESTGLDMGSKEGVRWLTLNPSDYEDGDIINRNREQRRKRTS